jgi:hypothetical protein
MSDRYPNSTTVIVETIAWTRAHKGAFGPSLLLASISAVGPSTTPVDEDNFNEIVTDDDADGVHQRR